MYILIPNVFLRGFQRNYNLLENEYKTDCVRSLHCYLQSLVNPQKQECFYIDSIVTKESTKKEIHLMSIIIKVRTIERFDMNECLFVLINDPITTRQRIMNLNLLLSLERRYFYIPSTLEATDMSTH